MPADLVTGDDARDVAAYVARWPASGGKDTGALAARRAAQGLQQADRGQGRHADDRRRPHRRPGVRLHHAPPVPPGRCSS